jgi:protein-S-isoprenylcysteine O-methyltransferase Ste14
LDHYYFPGIALYFWAYRTLGKMYAPSSAFGASVYADHRLVQEGPYAFIRHPMYLGVIVVAAGALLLFKTWAMILFTFSSLVVIFRARQEDLLLSDQFGEEWEAYDSRVPGWIPRRANTESAI